MPAQLIATRPPERVEIAPCRVGDLEVRLAATVAEVRAAQALRYAVFYREMSARPDARTRLSWRDADGLDDRCDHLIVVDHGTADGEIVGTYRLIDAKAAAAVGGFYSAGEYDLSALLALREPDGCRPNLLELGRSCVAPAYRTSASIMLLWRGIAAYLEAARIDYLFGCASFPGVDPDAIAAELALLHHRHRTTIAVRAWPELHVPMARVAPEALEERVAWRRLPPLVRGYLQAGASVGDGAYVDHQFGTVDVFMLVATAAIRDRYRARFASEL
jgi:putative hemolysin